ncbi:hypothetical protein AMATHDRAFT_49917 [Amanita thiersii Skay4041]|uniref:Uncharacterized protein n=1 Tax=Amanita thiersii Skay4041 TaxID=703135 RepID=A0A2A9NI42_9AGAR|nr:hypothetical protein AMATHDRAFT_49917 [Amanita thiersii Skay4041]
MFMTAISVIVYGFSPIPAGTFTAAEILRPTINFPITGITLNYILMRVARECAKSKNYPLEEEALEDEATLPTVAPEPIATPTLEHESEKLESSGIERVTQ